MIRLSGSVLLLLLLLHSQFLKAQEDLPQDYLSKEFHKGRREAARALMPANSVMVVFSAPTRVYSNDVDYFYHQNPDLYYFTGYKEANSVLLLFKEPQTAADGHSYTEMLFVQKRNPDAERWTGRRLGTEGARTKLGFNDVFNGEEFNAKAPSLTGFDKVIMDRFPEDVPPATDPGSLYKLLAGFRQKAGLTDFSPGANSLLDQLKNGSNYSRLKQQQEMVKNRSANDTQMAANPYIKAFLQVKDSADYVSYIKSLDNIKTAGGWFRKITAGLREIKTPEELVLLRKAVEISCNGQNEVMKAVRADMSELEIQGLHEYVHKKYGAESVGYGSIVGAGENGCVLHYMENTKTRVGRDLILMDVGAEYHGYTADVTRTVPADGKFSAEERAIYQIVYDAQEAAFKLLKDSARWSDAGLAAQQVIADGLIKLGIIKNKSEVGKFYPHGLSHHIGLDVHDKGMSQYLKKDMVITIEPGIYIPSNSDCDKKWWGISVRIEDDALITKTGYELLSSFAPRSIADIEKMIAQESALDKFKLPALKSGEPKKAF
jgi:Xaa-Pro aminopeptidase